MQIAYGALWLDLAETWAGSAINLLDYTVRCTPHPDKLTIPEKYDPSFLTF